MAHRATTRTCAAGAATTLALGALTLLSTGIAGAAPATTDWWDGNSHFTRTVSNTTPAIGETITVTTKFERGNSTDEKLNWVKDFHDPCLTYVPSSATMNGNPVEPYLQIAPNFIAGDFNATNYQVTVKQTEPATLTAQYGIGANCAVGAALNTGMDYSGSLGAGNYGGNGPQITIAKSNTSTTLAPVTGAKVGTATTLTATVTGAATGDTVEFKDGTTVLGTGQVGAAGTATYQWAPTVPGDHSLTAQFPGSATANGSQSAPQTVQVAVDSVDSTTTLAPVTGAKVGTAITLEATVNPAAAGGTITFKDGTTVLGTATVGNDGTATHQWTPTTAGQRTITANFSGHGTTNASTTHATVTVAPAGGTDPGGTGSLDSLLGGFGSSN